MLVGKREESGSDRLGKKLNQPLEKCSPREMNNVVNRINFELNARVEGKKTVNQINKAEFGELFVVKEEKESMSWLDRVRKLWVG